MDLHDPNLELHDDTLQGASLRANLWTVACTSPLEVLKHVHEHRHGSFCVGPLKVLFYVTAIDQPQPGTQATMHTEMELPSNNRKSRGLMLSVFVTNCYKEVDFAFRSETENPAKRTYVEKDLPRYKDLADLG